MNPIIVLTGGGAPLQFPSDRRVEAGQPGWGWACGIAKTPAAVVIMNVATSKCASWDPPAGQTRLHGAELRCAEVNAFGLSQLWLRNIFTTQVIRILIPTGARLGVATRDCGSSTGSVIRHIEVRRRAFSRIEERVEQYSEHDALCVAEDVALTQVGDNLGRQLETNAYPFDPVD